VDAGFDTKDLVEVNSRLERIGYSTSRSRGGSNKHLELTLANGETYRMSSEWEAKFEDIERALEKSDQIQLFHRKPGQVVWRLGSGKDVYHLKIGGQVFLSIEERKSLLKTLAHFTGTFALVGIFGLILRRRWLQQ
jgi:hypothetical protein